MIQIARKEGAMVSHPKQDNTPPPAGNEAGSAGRSPSSGSERRVVRSVDLTDDDIAAIEDSEMEPGFEHLNAEVDEA